MTPEEIIKNSKKIAILTKESSFPFDVGDYKKFFDENDVTIFGDRDESLYVNEEFNYHHYNPSYLYSNLMPIIAEKLNFDFNIDDFTICEPDSKTPYLLPKKKVIYTAFAPYSYIHNHKLYTLNKLSSFYHGDYRSFVAVNNCANFVSFFDCSEDSCTDYHRLFSFSHQCSVLVNESCNNERVLLISCDSLMIPLIMPISYYFKKVIVLDNRYSGTYSSRTLYANENITDSMIVFSDRTDLKKFLKDNLE